VLLLVATMVVVIFESEVLKNMIPKPASNAMKITIRAIIILL
jgi:hypothetical protein